MTLHKVFVYGSLKQGFGNYGYFLGQSEFNGSAVTFLPIYDLVSLGAFPAVLDNGEHSVAGELYTVSEETFARLDRLESNGSMYERELVPVATEEGKLVDAWMYIFINDNYDTPDPTTMHDNVDFLQTECGFFVQNWAQDRWPQS